jgi:flagellar biosynthesis anti-sigma factor FlgM
MVKGSSSPADNHIGTAVAVRGSIMRIDLHVAPREVSGPEKAARAHRPSRSESDNSSRQVVPRDQVHFSSQARIESLETHLVSLPEVRQDKTERLKKAVDEATYQTPPERIAEAIFSELLARSSLIR